MTISQPTWYFKPIDVPNLLAIQSEFQLILSELISLDEKTKYFHIDRDRIKSKVPSYITFLDSIGLLDRWNYSAIIATTGDEFPIHVDALDWSARCFALNIPIQNCEGSDTVWYDAIIDSTPIPGEETSNRKLARLCDHETAIEICRMPATTPAWINISLPHRPVTTHSKLRAIVSARFKPEIHDYFAKTTIS